MTYLDLWRILTDAEARVKEYTGSQWPEVAQRSQETVDLCHQRMEREGLTRDELRKLAGC
jgi:hypothetical protein